MLDSLTKEIYMLEEVAELLGVNVGTLYRWRKEGRFQAYKPGDGQRYRVRRAEVARLLGAAPDQAQGGTDGPHPCSIAS